MKMTAISLPLYARHAHAFQSLQQKLHYAQQQAVYTGNGYGASAMRHMLSIWHKCMHGDLCCRNFMKQGVLGKLKDLPVNARLPSGT